MAFVIRRIHASTVTLSQAAVFPLLHELRLTQCYREMMDTALTSSYQGAVSLVDHKGEEPARCLDIGTGVCVLSPCLRRDEDGLAHTVLVPPHGVRSFSSFLACRHTDP